MIKKPSRSGQKSVVSGQSKRTDHCILTTDHSSDESADCIRSRLLLIDNYDSFTWNLAQLFASLGAAVDVRKNDAVSVREVEKLQPDGIIISPGPGHPSQSSMSMKVIEAFAGTIPVLGVCLGHQCLGALFGSKKNVRCAPAVMHGKTSAVFHDGLGIMHGVPSPFTAARYHSLLIGKVPRDFRLMCWTGTQKKPDLIMGIRHETMPVFGVQFHPESFLTEHGERMAGNFLEVCGTMSVPLMARE